LTNLPSSPRRNQLLPPERDGGPITFLGGGGLAVVLTLAVVVGLQLGAIPWRFRREIWQLQGALAGGLVGYLVGWSVGRGSRSKENDPRPPLG
jgi:hypothetical protein